MGPASSNTPLDAIQLKQAPSPVLPSKGKETLLDHPLKVFPILLGSGDDPPWVHTSAALDVKSWDNWVTKDILRELYVKADPVSPDRK